MRYSAGPERRQGETLYVLRDAQWGAAAQVWPAFGNNCVSATLALDGETRATAVLGPDDLTQVRRQPSWWGVPLLFPWPGRIPGGAYVFGGRSYQLPRLDAGGNAIHGFVKDRPWRVDAAEGGEERARLSCSFDSADHPETLEGFAFPYRVEAEYRLDGAGLELAVTVQNPGGGPLPFGFGAHPYFRIPIGATTARGECLVQVPAERRWRLQKLAALDPQQPAAWEDVTEPVADVYDLRRAVPLGERSYDGGFTALRPQGGWIECVVADPRTGLALAMQATENFGSVVVYTPPDRPGICFEPWTCPPNVFNVAARGVAPSGLVVLAPGEQWQGTMRLRLRRLGSTEAKMGPMASPVSDVEVRTTGSV